MTSTSVEYRWGVRKRTTTEWRTLLRIAGGIWLANSLPRPLVYWLGRAEMPHPTMLLADDLFSMGFGIGLFVCAWLLSDSIIEATIEWTTLIVFVLSISALAFAMYCVGIHFSAPDLLGFDTTAILAFYLLRRSVAVAVCFIATAWYAGVLLAFQARGAQWAPLAILAVNLLAAGFLTSRLIDLIDRERTAKEAARAELAALNASLESRVAEQVEEIRDSRARIVDAADESRRRIERNIHDGAQQQLVAISLDLRMLAEDAAQLRPEEVRTQLHAAHANIRTALDDLRELARGLHPAVLTSDGLEAALGQLAARAPMPVSVVAPATRFAEHIETAAYFVAAEAVANVVKYAGASSVEIRLAQPNGNLEIAISDDGRGGATLNPGGGLAGLTDRVAAQGGSLSVTSTPGAGTIVAALLPLSAPSTPTVASTPDPPRNG